MVDLKHTAGDDYFTNGYDQFEDDETVDVSLILGGGATANQARASFRWLTQEKMQLHSSHPPETPF